MIFSLKHHGATTGVTGSCHQLFYDQPNSNRSILIDCGLFQGEEQAEDGSRAQQLVINFPVEEIQALVVTHVHIDHVGRIPYLLAAGFKGPIYCSEPSALLLPLVLEDALKIGFTRNQRLIDRFLEQIKQQIQPLPYKQWQPIAPHPNTNQLRIKLQPAGHILGSAYIECDLKTKQTSRHIAQHSAQDGAQTGAQNKTLNNPPNKTQTKRQRITFSGDLGAPYSPLLSAPRSPYRSDTLILESTYGDKRHQGRRERRNQLKQIIQRAIKNRGVILIPAFSIGRTQELLYELEELTHRENIDLEVIVDSPLAAQFTQTYRKLKHYWDKEAKRKLKRDRHPLAFEQLWTINDHATHQQTVDYLQKTAKPTIVIAASGMCSGGRIVNYLKALIEDQRTDILFVGYQAGGTSGRIIQKYGPKNGWVELDGKRYTIKAKTWTVSGYSAHADQSNLINFVKRMRHKPKEIQLVHGDERAKQALKRRLEELLPEGRVWVP